MSMPPRGRSAGDEEGRRQSNETLCPESHATIEAAIVCAEKHLGSFRMPMSPYWGTLRANDHLVVGFQLSSRQRWRLDYAPDPDKLVHVNEENFDATPGHQRIVHKVEGQTNDTQVMLYYHKWTSQYGQRP